MLDNVYKILSFFDDVFYREKIYYPLIGSHKEEIIEIIKMGCPIEYYESEVNAYVRKTAIDSQSLESKPDYMFYLISGVKYAGGDNDDYTNYNPIISYKGNRTRKRTIILLIDELLEALTTPYSIFDDELNVETLEKPTGKDAVACGKFNRATTCILSLLEHMFLGHVTEFMDLDNNLTFTIGKKYSINIVETLFLASYMDYILTCLVRPVDEFNGIYVSRYDEDEVVSKIIRPSIAQIIHTFDMPIYDMTPDERKKAVDIIIENSYRLIDEDNKSGLINPNVPDLWKRRLISSLKGATYITY